MEGTAGVCSWEQCDPSNTIEYPTFRRIMTREVRAAIDGAREAGVGEVLINDSHWNMHNLLFDELPADVRVLSGHRKPHSMVQHGNEGFDGAFFTGYHAGIGTQNAVLAHTYSPGVIYSIRINGIECNEALLNAAYLGAYDVPVLLLTGDRATCEQTKAYLPWIHTAVVKESIGYYSTNSLTPDIAQTLIREAAREAVARRAECKPFRFAGPITMEIETTVVECADYIELIPGFTRTAGRSLRFVAPHFVDAFNAFIAAMRIGRGAAEKA